VHQWDYACVAEVGVFLEAEIQMQVYVSQRRQHFPVTWYVYYAINQRGVEISGRMFGFISFDG